MHSWQTQDTNPHDCRLRDLTYAAPILVDVIYWKGDRRIRKRDVEIGMLPVMLRSNLCALSGKTEEEVVKAGECPYDPGGQESEGLSASWMPSTVPSSSSLT
eukprot:s617_g4.t1